MYACDRSRRSRRITICVSISTANCSMAPMRAPRSRRSANLDRGAHSLVALILDDQGNELIRSEPRVFHIRQPSVNATQNVGPESEAEADTARRRNRLLRRRRPREPDPGRIRSRAAMRPAPSWSLSRAHLRGSRGRARPTARRRRHVRRLDRRRRYRAAPERAGRGLLRRRAAIRSRGRPLQGPAASPTPSSKA